MNAPSSSTRTSIMPPRPARLSTVVQRGGRIQLLFAAPGAALEQHAFLDLEAAFQHARQRGLRSCSGMSVMKPSRPWLMPTSGTPKGARWRAAPSTVPSPPMTTASEAFWPISSSEAAGVGEPGVARGVGVDQQLPTGLPERERERPQRCVQAGVLVSADQGDGGKVHGCERIRKGDAGKRDTCPEWASLPIIWGRIYACGTKIASIGKDSLKYPPWTTVHARY